MDERTLYIIDRYLSGEATEAERREVETRRHDDPDFARQLEDAEAVVRALMRVERKNLREKFASWDAELDAAEPESKDRRRFRPWWWLLAAAVLGLIILLRVTRPASGSDHPEQSQQDSLAPVEAPDMAVSPADVDSTEVLPADDKPSGTRQERKPAKSLPDGKALFAEYFKPHKDLTLQPVDRAVDGPEELFETQYWYGEYAEAVRTFAELPDRITRKETARFAYANALMAEGRIEEAYPLLQELVESGTSRYAYEARFTLALADLFRGDNDAAIAGLIAYSDLGDFVHHREEATSLLVALGRQ